VIGTSNRTATDLGEFTRNLALLAVHDLDYPWECLGAEPDGPAPLPLLDFPNTRMNETRLWQRYRPALPQTATATSVALAAEPARESVAETTPARLFVEEWVRLSQRSLVPPRAIGIVDHTGACAELATALCQAASDVGATAHLIGDESAGIRSDFNTLAILLPQSPTLDDGAAAAEVATFFSNRTWWPGLNDAISDCWLVTVGGEAVVADDAPPDPVHAAASAGFRSIGAEHLGIAFRHLDLPAASTTSELANAILTVLHTSEESELAFRNGGLYAKRLAEGATSVADHNEKRLEHVVITGGTGHLGLEFCDHFAHRGARRITLLSRSGETAAAADRLRQIRSATTTEILVAKCDIGDRAAVSRLAEQFQDAPADLIIHSAVDYSDIELEDITSEKVEKALRAKVVGIWQMMEAFPRTDNCRVILCSSTAATIGGRGQVAYAAANRMLDAMAHRLRADGLDCVSVQWGQWTVHLDLGASGKAKLAGTGMVPMSPADALVLGMSRLGGNAIVAAFDLARARSALATLGYGPLVSELTSPVVETRPPVQETNLSQRFIKLLAKAIGVDNPDAIDTTVPMVAIGLDSLQALEFRRRVQIEFNHDLNVADILGGASVADVLAQLGAQSQGPRQPAGSPGQVATADRKALIEPSDVFQRAQQVADEVIPSTMDMDRLRSARADLDLVGMRAMMSTLYPALSDKAAHTVENIAAQLEFAPRHQWLLKRWLGVLTAHGHLDLDSDRGYRLLHPVPDPRCADLFSLCADLGYPRALTIFMQSCNEHLTELAQDRIRVQELLFADGEMVTAVAGYRDNVIGQYLNRGAREIIADFVTGLKHDRSPVRILELGAGTGGTTDDVIAGLSGMPVDYHFTDVSKFFLRAAQERFAEYPQIRYGILDLNTDLRQHSRYDIVLAANVLHNALHIGQTLRQLQEMINPGGAIVFIETCKANYQLLTSLKFLMSPNPGQPHPGQSDIRAGARIFLTEDEWLDQLCASGFAPLPVLPPADHPLRILDQRIFAAVREQ
jgi:mycobactin polyketide synthetase MbtD